MPKAGSGLGFGPNQLSLLAVLARSAVSPLAVMIRTARQALTCVKRGGSASVMILTG